MENGASRATLRHFASHQQALAEIVMQLMALHRRYHSASWCGSALSFCGKRFYFSSFATTVVANDEK
jgi:hypothetical protein